jgi:hypothetical protein
LPTQGCPQTSPRLALPTAPLLSLLASGALRRPEDDPVASFATSAGRQALRAAGSFVALTNVLCLGALLALPLLLLSRP